MLGAGTCSAWRVTSGGPSLCCFSCTVQGKVRWAMAGRNKAKLEEIKQQLSQYDPDIQVCCCGGWGVSGLHPDPPPPCKCHTQQGSSKSSC